MLSGAGSHSSAATAGGVRGSPSDRAAATPSAASTPAVSTPPSASIAAARRLKELDVTPPSQPSARKKKKGGARAVGADNNGVGLRQLSKRVCEIVESKGTTTQNEVADELVAEFKACNVNIEYIDPDNPFAQQLEDKNIRRRVYDALNVLLSAGIISKDKKEIQWKGLPNKKSNEIEQSKSKLTGLKDRIDKKNTCLQDLEDKYACMQNLVRRNKQLDGFRDTPSAGFALPFLLVKTDRDATLEVEISEDDSLSHLDFNNSPFELWDESAVMKAMGLCGKDKIDGTQASVANHGECSGTPTNYKHEPLQPPGP